MLQFITYRCIILLVSVMQKLKKILLNSYVESAIISILPLIYGILLPLAFANGWDARNETLFFISLILIVMHIGTIIAYAKAKSKNSDNITKAAEEQLKSITELHKETDKFIHDISISLYETISSKNKHSDVVNWEFLQFNGDTICKAAHKVVKNIAVQGSDFSVSVMFRQKKNGANGFTMIARTSDENSHNPASYHNFIPEDQTKGMYYRKIFDQSPTSPQILHDRRAIEENFKEPDSKRYSQYIVLPILCKDKAVALLQVVAYNNSKIAEGEEALRKLCDDYLSLYANLLLLTDKIENASQLIEKVETQT